MAAALAFAAPAYAADIPVRLPVKAPPAPTIYNWSGFYVGAHVGYGRVDPTANFNPAILPVAVPGLLTLPTTDAPFALSFHESGWLGGLQLGYNWQNRNWVFGLEADVTLPRLRGDASRGYAYHGIIFVDPADLTGTFRFTHEIEMFGTVRGRLGYAFDTLLLYATGGFAWGRVESTIMTANITGTGFPPGLPPDTYNRMASANDTMTGYAVGAGLDWAIARNWWLRGEYLFVALNNGGTPLFIPGGSFTDTNLAIHVGRIALNYRFQP